MSSTGQFYEQSLDNTEPDNDSGGPKTGEEDEYDRSNDSEVADGSSDDQEEEIDQSVMEEMTNLENILYDQGLKFRFIGRIGEGTFSTVYKAEDLDYEYYQNEWDTQNRIQWLSPPVKRKKKTGSQSSSLKQLGREPHYVAIKKIYVTSSPTRIQNELELLHDLRGYNSVCPLITAFRHQDQVVAVLPYFRHQDFRGFYRQMNSHDIRLYFRSLFEALAAVHRHGIIHRDIKPTLVVSHSLRKINADLRRNFLYDIERKRGVLVDFGLAERQGRDFCLCQESPQGRRDKIDSSKAAYQPKPIGYPKSDPRPSRRANRAGTRGFRAPEVLLKCTSQSTKIDIWSAGVILLTILARRFPFFNSADDVEALIEIASIFGMKRMKQCAILHGAVFECTLPTIGEAGHPLEELIQWSVSNVRPEDADDLDPETKEIVKFLKLLLEMDPRKRISARGALLSSFLKEKPDLETEDDEMDVLVGA